MIYPKNFESKIGFSEIRKLLKGLCLSSLGTEEVDNLSFQNDVSNIRRQLQQIHEFRTILQLEDDFPSENFLDMRSALIHIQVKGTYMEEPDLFALKSSLVTISTIVDFFKGEENEDGEQTESDYPALQALTREVACFPKIIQRIDEILNKFGKIKDNASPELQTIRKNLVSTKRSITVNLHNILHSAQQNGYVEHDVSPTFRDGRLVIPIAQALKRKIKGIVHDESATGKTVFVEPAEVVEANNKVRELELEERRAIIVILMSVADFIRPDADNLVQSYKFLGRLDFIRAKALFAENIGAIEPLVEDKPLMDWVESIHPLLQMSLRKHDKKMSSLDIAVDERRRIVLISGPNAGGKSVCLKTAGLLQYMVQCGLSVPMRENSKVGLFKSIFIDIGDEQSIENDLSTYSSHLLNMKIMMKQCDSHSLILIDEFGGGTEPQIGAAIAEAVLNRFIQKKTFGIITTHYQNLKYFADTHEGIVNGAMLYDRQLMQPLFELQIGHAGSSFAIEIARKIGLPEDVIREASESVGSDYIQSDKYVQDIVRDKRYWENKRSTIHQREKHLEELMNQYENNVHELAEKRREVMRVAKEKAENILKESNAQIESTIRSIREAQAEKEQTKKLRQSLDEFKQQVVKSDENELEEQIVRKIKQIQARRERQKNRKEEQRIQTPIPISHKSEKKDEQRLQVGMYVKIKGQTSVGKIMKLDGREALLNVGSMQLRIEAERLMATSAPEIEAVQPVISVIGKATRDEIYEKKLNFKPDIDVRGMNGEEALAAVTYFIDDAILLGVARVRILHGTGTGYLRKIIRQYLRTVPGVTDCRDEHVQFGGAGITIVDL